MNKQTTKKIDKIIIKYLKETLYILRKARHEVRRKYPEINKEGKHEI